MTPFQELFAIAERLDKVNNSAELDAAEPALKRLLEVASEANGAFSGSWIGYHASVYYDKLQPPPPGAHFSQEWGLMDTSFTSMGTRGDWQEMDPKAVLAWLKRQANDPDLSELEKEVKVIETTFGDAKSQVSSILTAENTEKSDAFLVSLIDELDSTRLVHASDLIQYWSPKGQFLLRDMVAHGQGTRIPPHKTIEAEVVSIRLKFDALAKLGAISRKGASHLERKSRRTIRDARVGTNVFIGHGRSSAWRELKDFLEGRLGLPWDEFNRVPVAGITNQSRLAEMLDASAIAFVIMTAEDENIDGEIRARMNVIHEVGLFQGRLGFTKAIVLLEEGCEEFSNIQGLGQIRFPKNNITACFEDVRRVLEREGII